MPKYNIGDYVIYSVNGACRIVEIGPLSFGGPDKIYYSMKPVNDDRSTIYLPIAKEDDINRPVMSCDEMTKVLEDIAKSKPLKGDISREKCEPIIKSGDLVKISQLIKRIRLLKIENRKAHKGLNIQEEKLLREAEIVIYSEISVSLDIAFSDVSIKYSELFD